MNKQMRYENPVRLQELNPRGTLSRIGLQKDQVVCDIGAGSGIFTILAASMTGKTVFALEIDDELINVIKEKAKQEGLNNIQVMKVQDDRFDLESSSIDLVLLVTVLHEISDKVAFLEEVKRILNDHGKIAVIEFHKCVTPMGPPLQVRLGQDELLDLFAKVGYQPLESFELGANFNCSILKFEKGMPTKPVIKTNKSIISSLSH